MIILKSIIEGNDIMKNKVSIYSSIAIVILIVVVTSAAFAFFGSFSENLNGNVAVNIQTVSPGESSLVSSSAVLNLQVPAANMSQLASKDYVAAAESSAVINISLSGESDVSTRCTYDIVFEYNTNSNIYGQSPTTKTADAEYEITFEVEGPIAETNPFGIETNIDYNTSKGWIAKTSTTGAKIKLATGARITNNGGTPNTQSWKVIARYYNIKKSQDQLIGKNFAGKIYAENPVCEGVTPDAEDFIKNIAAEGEKTSSQDTSTKYLVANENGYRYEGKDPDNYICLDNNSSGTCAEDNTFRIIGVFDEKVGASETDAKLQPVIKIIKSTNYTSGGIVWNDKNSADWSTSSLKTLLNGTYLTSLNSYNHADKILNTKWVNVPYSFNERARYNPKFVSPTASDFFKFERYSRWFNDSSIYTYAKIGLMSVSDYSYGVMSTECARTIGTGDDEIFDDYGSIKKCSTQNWLYNKKFDKSLYDGGDDLYYYIQEWTMIPYENSYVLVISANGGIPSHETNTEYHKNAVRPSMFLDTSIELIGSGSLSNPYRIK